MTWFVLCGSLVLSMLQPSTELRVRDFYPFGVTAADSSLSPNDDDFARVQLSVTVPFFGTGHNRVFINNNGLLSFGKPVSLYTPKPFPLDDNRLIAPYWADVDTREAGTVWFREVKDTSLLNRIYQDLIHIAIDETLNFESILALIVTWERVGYYSSHSDLTNTFQCVLVSDGLLSFVIFHYADGGIQWTTGDNSGGAGGLGGTPALAGVNAGDGIRSETVGGSRTRAIVNITKTSNVKISGMWVFQVNRAENRDSSMCGNEEIFSNGITYNWPMTPSGSSASFSCPNNPTYTVNRECSVEGLWQDFDLDACGLLTEELNNLLDTKLNVDILQEFVAKFSDIVALSTDSRADQNKETLKLIARIFQKVTDFIIQFNVMIGESEIVENIVEMVNVLFQWNPSAIEVESSSRIIKSFEQVASFYTRQLSDNTSQIFNLTSTILVTERLNLKDLQSGGRTFNSGDREATHSLGKDQLNDTSQPSSRQDAVIHLPASLFDEIQNRKNIEIFFAFYDQPTLFPVDTKATDTQAPSLVQVGSSVIASTVGGDSYSFEDLNEPVLITLKLKADFAIPGSETCASWDFNLRDWTPQGCNTSIGHGGMITCSCSHLTNFAVLVDICSRQEECGTSKVETALTYISYIGISASIISLVLALIILLSHKRIRQKTITKYHVQLSLSLLLLFLVSLVFVILSAENITALYGGCVTISVLVHYFALVAVMWMGAEALFMFQKLVLVFVHITTKYLIIVSTICWGLPIFFVLIPLLTDIANGSDPMQDIVIKRASFPSYCFLSNVGAFWGTFLAPIFIILLFNLVIFIWISVVLIHHVKRTASRKKEIQNRHSIIRLMISIGGVMFLFGLTWLFAILTFSVTGLRETFQILFTLFNSFQGFFIFLFFCAINKEARESWKEMFGSSRQSELLHTPCAISNGHSLNKSHSNKFKAQRSATDTSTVKHHDHILTTSKLGESRKYSWDSENSGHKTDVLHESDVMIFTTAHSGILLKDAVAEKDKIGSSVGSANPIALPEQDPKHDALSIASATTESGIDPDDRASLGNDHATFEDGSPPSPSNVAELESARRHTDPKAIDAKGGRKDGVALKVHVKRYSSMIKREYDVEEMKVEFHSESSSESSNEDEHQSP